MKKSVNVLP